MITVKIDNINISNYGASLDGNINDLIAYPPLKDVKIIDWPDKNGIDPDLSEPVLDACQIKLSFYAPNGISSLMSVLAFGGYHVFEFVELGITRSLRMIGSDNNYAIGNADIVTIKFANDFPMQGYEYLPPNGQARSYGYVIDSTDLSSYGLVPLYGIVEQMRKNPEVKKNLTKTVANVSGVEYDAEKLLYTSKDVSLKLYYNGPYSDFWRNYNALLYNLIQPGTRMFRVGTKADAFYYKKCTVDHFSINNQNARCVFSLDLCFTM